MRIPLLLPPNLSFTPPNSRAPPHLLNVQSDQPVELRVSKRLTENYKPFRRPSTFAGSGSRLGAPTPQARTDTIPETMPGSFPGGPSTSRAAGPSDALAGIDNMTTKFEVDLSQPTTSVQVRLADGTR